jgi:hypothetical protein
MNKKFKNSKKVKKQEEVLSKCRIKNLLTGLTDDETKKINNLIYIDKILHIK